MTAATSLINCNNFRRIHDWRSMMPPRSTEHAMTPVFDDVVIFCPEIVTGGLQALLRPSIAAQLQGHPDLLKAMLDI